MESQRRFAPKGVRNEPESVSGFIGISRGGIKRYWQGVLNNTLSRITNGVAEGLNSKIKTAMKRAYGFKQTQYLKTIVYLVVGKLCFD